MIEADVQSSFVQWLLDRGWDVRTDSPDHTDVIAKRGAERLVAEVKGHTASPGLDVDTAYGQLLRRMDPEAHEMTRYALVVPETLWPIAERVPRAVRRRLDVYLYLVDDVGSVRVSAAD